ncbi:restriction endonuclease subunit S [Thermaerobacter sp. PB12/4term]|uniref:restriction endonuclease subunit S n=1 Tax=Thermaerobacter sp. PB12/4term TaxID=2293838 RepID=UPI0011C07DB3|nr:restriction endonuclease subunit S [Thermaerobacter sp. PB12/4term]QIA27743.1 restriction endonuclease subunit S [Thermaerobacter sp. PB12/4term]
MAETVELGTEATAELPDGFKKTELGPLPQDWQVVRLGEVAELRLGRTPPRKDSRYWDGGTIPWVTISDLNNGIVMRTAEKITDIAHEQIFRNKFVPVGTLLLSFKLTVGKVGLLGIPAVHNEAIASVYPGRLVHKDFLFYLFQGYNFDPLLDSYVKGKTLNTEKLKQLPIPLPTPSEQCAIAYVLHIVRQAKEATEKVLAATRELKKSLMRHLFTYGPVPVEEAERVPLKETEIGLVPEHWQIVRLEDVVRPIKQIDPKKFPEQRFRYIDVSSIDNQQLRVVGHQDVLGKYAPSRARKLIKAGDVIFATVRPYLKRIALVTPEYDGQICSTAFCVLRADGRSVISNYLFSAVSHDRFVDSISEYQRGSSYPAVTDGDVLRGLIPLPPLSEQKGIASILRTVDDKIQAEEVFKHALDVLFKALLHLLMTGRVRVKDLSLPETEGVASGASRE